MLGAGQPNLLTSAQQRAVRRVALKFQRRLQAGEIEQFGTTTDGVPIFRYVPKHVAKARRKRKAQRRARRQTRRYA